MQVQACNSRFEECCSRLLLALSVAVIAEPQQWESALVGILAGLLVWLGSDMAKGLLP